MYVRSASTVNAQRPAGAAHDMTTPGRPCQVPGCSAEIRPGHLMCRQHWLELPSETAMEVVTTLAQWIAGHSTVRPYLAARLKALVTVGKLHGCDVAELERELASREKNLGSEAA